VITTTHPRPTGWRRPALAALAAVVALVAAGGAHASRSAAPASHPGPPATTVSRGGSGGQGNGASGPPQTTPARTTPAPAHAAASGSAKGIVQSVAGGAVVVTQLDGSSVSIAVGAGTRVFLDGRRASVADLKPGFVLSASFVGGIGRVLQAFDLSAPAIEVGVVRSLSGRTVVVGRSGGGTATLRVGPRTRLLLDGAPTTLRAVRAGFTVVFAAADAKARRPSGELRFLRPV